MSRNGETVKAFERAFADYVGAKYAIALVNGTATLHTALVALGVQPGDRVAVPPLTMSSTTIAVLHSGAVPVFMDVLPNAWIASHGPGGSKAIVPVSLYGLCCPEWAHPERTIDDAAQTLRKHSGCAFTSYSFQASKILSTGEGGMLVTNDEELATRAREFSSLGYRMRADQPRIDSNAIKSPTFERHHSLGWNYRMNDVTAAEGLKQLDRSSRLSPVLVTALELRAICAALYARAIEGCNWLTPQHVPEGWTHDYWTFAVACDSADRANLLADQIVHYGGERPYPAWKLSYQEPALRYAAPPAYLSCGQYATGLCPVAESLQPRLLQMQTNSLASAERNADALRLAIQEMT